MIGSNLDTCTSGPPSIKLMDYAHREDAVGGGGRRRWHTHTHTQCPSRYKGSIETREGIGRNLGKRKHDPPTNYINGL